MKQKLKKLKQVFAITLAGILIFGCQVEEELANPDLFEQKGVIMHKKFEDLIKETQFKTAFDKMNQPKKGSSQKGETTSKTVMEKRYDFTIVDFPANVIVKNSDQTYTFLIKRDSITKNTYENLVIKVKSNANPTAYIIKYEKQNITNNTLSNLQSFDKVINMTEIVYDVSQVASLVDTERCETLHIWICNYNPTHDSNTVGCTGESGGSVTVCEGGSGDSDTTSGNTYTTYGIPNYSSSTNSSSGTGGGATTNNINTAPVVPLPDPAPCEKIKAKTNAQFMLNFNNINTPTYLNSGLETGFVEKKQYGVMQYVFIPGNPDGSSMKPPAGSVSFTHVHPNKPITNENGNTVDQTVKMLSPEDLKYLITKCRTAAIAEGLTPQDAQAVMISNEGIFSLSITDANIDFSFITANWADFEIDYEKLSGEILSETNLTPLQRNEKLQTMMLNLLDNLGLSKNIALFEGIVTPTPAGNALNWTQKKLSNDKRNPKPVANPC